MEDRAVKVYVSNNCTESNKLIHFLHELDVDCEVKNITDNKDYLKELQEQHIYATPVVMINEHTILGFQKRKLEHELNDYTLHR